MAALPIGCRSTRGYWAWVWRPSTGGHVQWGACWGPCAVGLLWPWPCYGPGPAMAAPLASRPRHAGAHRKIRRHIRVDHRSTHGAERCSGSHGKSNGARCTPMSTMPPQGPAHDICTRVRAAQGWDSICTHVRAAHGRGNQGNAVPHAHHSSTPCNNMCVAGSKCTHSVSGTQTFEFPRSDVTLSQACHTATPCRTQATQPPPVTCHSHSLSLCTHLPQPLPVRWAVGCGSNTNLNPNIYLTTQNGC